MHGRKPGHGPSGRHHLDTGVGVGILTKFIIILVLIQFITGQITSSKSKRAANRQKTTNILLVILIITVAMSIVTSFVRD